MENWTTEGHLTELALGQHAAGELAAADLQAVTSHLQGCQACRAREGEWRGIFLAVAALRGAEPSPGFDDRVMELVRVPVEAPTAAPGLMPRTVRRLRRLAVAATTVWTAGLAGGAAWLHFRHEVGPGALLARLLASVQDVALAGAIKLGTLIELSGIPETAAGAIQAVPGAGLVAALAGMTALSGVAVWTLYRVTGYQPSRVNGHG